MLKAFTDKRLQTYKPTEKKQRIGDPATKGLYFIIEPLPNGSKAFAFRYTLDGKRKQIAIGQYPATGLADARGQVLAFNKMIEQGLDPKQVRDQSKQQRQQERLEQEAIENRITFEQAYNQYCKFKTTPINDNQAADWSYSTLVKHNNRMNNFVLPILGARPLAEITTADLEAVLLKVQAHGTLANRDKLKILFNGFFDYCTYHFKDPISDEPLFAHNIALLISKIPFIKQQSKPFAHVTTTKELGEVVRAIDGMVGSYEVKQAIRLGMMLFLRPANITSMMWNQVSFEDATITYTAEQMKMRNAFMSPIPTQAVEILRQMEKLTGHSEYVFLSPYAGMNQPISRDSLSNALRRNNINLVAHGLRHTASTILNEKKFNADVIEAQLSHTTKGTRGVYNKAVYLDERRVMLQYWADLLDSLKTGQNVIPFNQKQA